jgi:hypothetical protein
MQIGIEKARMRWKQQAATRWMNLWAKLKGDRATATEQRKRTRGRGTGGQSLASLQAVLHNGKGCAA